MNKTTQVSEAMVYLADKLGYTTSQLFQIYTEAQQAQAIADAVSWGAVFLIMGIWGYLGYRFTKWASKDEEAFPDGAFYLLVYGALFAFLVAYGVFDVVNGWILKMSAPEYMAAKELLATVQGVMP